MKLLTVTIKSFRVHKELTVDFDAARTVVGGSNEAGKSTLVEAIHNALFLRSRTTGAAHKAMLSEIHPGHPTVELTFESGGRAYTVTKVFSGNASATTLLREHSGATAGSPVRTLRDDEAESRIHEILRAEMVGSGRNIDTRVRMQWAHLWVWQGTATDDPLTHANSDRHSELLRERLSRLDGGGVLESPLDAAAARDVAARHTAAFTDRGKTRSGSDLDRAAGALRVAEDGHARALAAVETLNEAIDMIELADRTIATCDLKLVEARVELGEVRDRQNRAAEIAVQIAEEQAAAGAAEVAHADAVRADTEIGNCRAAIENLEARMDPGMRALGHLEKMEAEANLRCETANRGLIDSGQRQAAATVAFTLRDACEKHSRLLVEREGLGGRCELLAAQRAKAKDLAAERDQLPPVRDAELARITNAEREHELAEATLAAIATRIELLSAAVPVSLAGKDLAPSTPVTITSDAELALGPDAIAVVRISPGGGRTLADATRRMAEARAALDESLRDVGVGTVAAARETHARRQVLDAEIKAVTLAIGGLGGDRAEADLADLEAEITKAAAEIRRRAPEGFIPPGDLGAAQAALAAVQRELADAGEAVAAANAEAADARGALESLVARRLKVAEELVASRTELEALRIKAGVFEERHGTDRAPRIDELAEERDLAATRVSESRRKLAALSPEALELDRQRLERTISNLTVVKQDAETRRHMARAKLEARGTTDPRDDLARAASRRRMAGAEHARAKRDAEAVSLLATLFAEKKRQVEEQFVTPLTSRVSGYLERLYGAGTAVGVEYADGRFSRLTLSRPGVTAATFEFAQLSSGAKEQVGAAFRLAMAEVLAQDHGGTLPVIFDDAFANSDTDRQRGLQRLLDLAASRGLQIIVLACRPESYATLGAATVMLEDNPFSD